MKRQASKDEEEQNKDDTEGKQVVVKASAPVAVLSSRQIGPANPNKSELFDAKLKNIFTGRLDKASISDFDFEAQRRSFDRLGYARDPENPERFLGDANKAKAMKGILPLSLLLMLPLHAGASVFDRLPTRTTKARRAQMGEASDIEGFKGPWAGYENEQRGVVGPSEADMLAYLHEKARTAPPTLAHHIALGQERSLFHGKSERDYLGRTYMQPPQDEDTRLDKEPGTFECFAPKRHIHTWSGHTKGVSAIRFLPRSGHLLLSASQDTRIKIWEVYGERQCLRTYLGHNKPVRDVCFDYNGAHFASCAYDRTVKYWDTETGKCLNALQHTAIPYCVRIHPAPDHNQIVLAGTADNRIMQWDMRTGQLTQEYNQHLDAVNSITFFDNNRRFVSSSDDKTLRVWDYDIPVTIKYVADPAMHSMPCATLHPQEPYIAFQSLNNRILVYSVQDRLQLRHKKFVGHSTAGYACQVGFSPDGKYIISGDGRGHLLVWDWKSAQLARRIEAHTQVCIDVQWNPQQPSRVATCSWDGTIKYWD